MNVVPLIVISKLGFVEFPSQTDVRILYLLIISGSYEKQISRNPKPHNFMFADEVIYVESLIISEGAWGLLTCTLHFICTDIHFLDILHILSYDGLLYGTFETCAFFFK